MAKMHSFAVTGPSSGSKGPSCCCESRTASPRHLHKGPSDRAAVLAFLPVTGIAALHKGFKPRLGVAARLHVCLEAVPAVARPIFVTTKRENQYRAPVASSVKYRMRFCDWFCRRFLGAAASRKIGSESLMGCRAMIEFKGLPL